MRFLLIALLLTACSDVMLQGDRPTPPPVDQPSTPTAAPTVDPLAEVRRFRSARPDPSVPLPVRIDIPSIDVTSGLQRLGRDTDGAIEVPSRWQVAGWYAEGVRPGQAGPAVIVGHVDSTLGPAVFHRLRELERGDEIEITRGDGSVVAFVVDRLEQHDKTRFPTDEVYLPTLQPSLRLVTCDGTFDAVTRHYRNNLVVFADLQA